MGRGRRLHLHGQPDASDNARSHLGVTAAGSVAGHCCCLLAADPPHAAAAAASRIASEKV